MTITSPEFAGFVLLVLILHSLLPRRWQNPLLLLASYTFLISWDVSFALVFAVLTLVNYGLAQRATQRIALWAGLIINIAALVFFKYQDFFLPELGITSDGLHILLPVGLSFYVVQAIAYLLDINKGLIEPERNPLTFALYMAYFPRVTSGPLERAREFLPRLKAERRLTYAGFSSSFTVLMLGLVRKLAVADVLFIILPEDVFSAPKDYDAAELTIWLLVYAFALYNDFAGYTSIVRGVSGLLGIELSSNFNVPYFARNFTEFWGRWHITLSDWLRDYIFTPTLRGLLRRKYTSRHALTILIPPLLTMFVSALWHGVSLNMLLWGGLHGVYQVVERIRAVWYPSRPPDFHPWWRQAGGMLLVFLLVVIAWVPFRADLPEAFEYWAGLLDWSHLEIDLGYHLYSIALVIILGSLVVDGVQYRYSESVFLKLPPLTKAVLINLALVVIILGVAAQGDAPPPFIYQGF
jgi:D-alanyl-lipoteichoic acid acyltransferase DltB (MBOAT superfamily)